MRRLTAAALGVAALAAFLASAAWADDAVGPTQEMVDEAIEAYFESRGSWIKAEWKNGLQFTTFDGKAKVKIFGRVQSDWTWFGEIEPPLEAAVGGEWHSGHEFRRARVGMEGVLYGHFKFKVQPDFAGGDVDFRDFYVALTDLDECFGCGFPDVRVGHFKESFSLEDMTSSRFITFLERALPVTTFAPGRNAGLDFRSTWLGDRVTAALGVFGERTDDVGDYEWRDHGYAITGRLTWLPWVDCDCPDGRYVHLGAAGSYRNEIEDVRFRTRPETHLGPRIVDTGTFAADSRWLLGAEAAFVYDRLHVSGEFITTTVEVPAGNDPSFWGWYAQAGYFLTGPTRAYKRSAGAFDRVKPCAAFLGKDCSGAGAWEVAVRYSFVDLDDEGIFGGQAQDLTIGLNWYLNPNARVQFNYVFVESDDPHGVVLSDSDDDFGFFAVRLQAYW